MERNFMSKYIDCTMPFYDYMPVGNVWAWDVLPHGTNYHP